MMPAGPSGPTPAQIAAQQQAEHAAHIKQREDAKNRSRKPTNKNVPDGLEEVVIGDGVQQYKSLRDVERRLDAVMMRKRLDIQDSQPKGSKQYGTMRIWITNTVDNQPWQSGAMDPHAFDFNSNVEATFKVKIEGRLLDAQTGEPEKEDEKDAQDGTADGERAAKRTKLSSPQNSRKRFSHFFKSISVDFDRPQAFQPDGYTQIKWMRPDYAVSALSAPPPEADFDCLEFQRKADENINVTVNVVRDEQPERYKLSQPLAELLDMEEADRHTVLMGLWEYIKVAGLPMDEEQRRIQCDSKFREVYDSV
jgi:SWI/SNF-related matrix-associated actin-dependent regulator of chromatin subfamily D